MRTGRKPDLNLVFIKTFGAPLQYAPMSGAEHKRGQLTEWGWFLGIQWPFVLVATKVDNWKDCKIINVSRKKVTVYELANAFFDPKISSTPDVNCKEVNVNDNGFCELSKENETSKETRVNDVPDHVLSVKDLHDNLLNSNVSSPELNLSSCSVSQSAAEYTNQGEGIHMPEHVSIDSNCTSQH